MEDVNMWIKNIFLFCIFCFFTSSCGWLGILDTNPYDDKSVVYRDYHNKKVEEVRQKLLGLPKEEVLANMGKPSWVLDLGPNYQSPTKFRDNEYVFDGKKKCLMSECGPILEDEKWAYNCDGRGDDYCGFGVFFKNGIVAAVE